MTMKQTTVTVEIDVVYNSDFVTLDEISASVAKQIKQVKEQPPYPHHEAKWGSQAVRIRQGEAAEKTECDDCGADADAASVVYTLTPVTVWLCAPCRAVRAYEAGSDFGVVNR